MAVAKEASEEDHDPDDDIPALGEADDHADEGHGHRDHRRVRAARRTILAAALADCRGRRAGELHAHPVQARAALQLRQRQRHRADAGARDRGRGHRARLGLACSASRATSQRVQTGTERIRRENRSDEGLRILIRTPCDTVALARSSELPKSIYDEGEAVFGTSERDALVAEALTLGAQPDFAPQRPTFSYGLPYTRFNRIEGFSTALAADQVLGRGYSAHAQLRLGVADLSPNGELWLDRTDGRQTLGLGVYRRLVASNDWGDPLGFSSSVSALLFGRDEGFYYRTWGAELKGQKDQGIINNWRLFGEQHFDAAVKTEFSLSHPGGVKGDLTNINAVNGTIVGLAVGHHSSHGLDPHGFRALTDIKLEGGAGTFDYSRGSLQTTLSHSLGSAARWRAHARRGHVRRIRFPFRSSFSSAVCRRCAVRERAPRSVIRSG